MDNFDSSIVKYLIGASRIKFNILEELFHGVYIDKRNGVSMWIDAHSIFYRLYRNKDLSALQSVDHILFVKDLVVNFINVLGHYRRFFATRFQAPNRIYVLYNRTSPAYHESLHRNFRHDQFSKYNKLHHDYSSINSAVIDAIEYVKSTLVYLDGIYYVDTDGIDNFTTMRFLMMQPEEEGRTHIIFSKDMIPTQLIGPQVYQLYPKRDKSFIIDQTTVYSKGILNGRKKQAQETLSPKYLPFIFALGGCSDIDLERSKYCTTMYGAVKLVTEMDATKEIYPEISIQSFLEAGAKHVDGGYEFKMSGKMLNRFRVVDIESSVSALSTSQKIQICSSLIDLYDQTALEELNDMLSRINSDGELLDITNLNMSLNDTFSFEDVTI